MVKRDVTVFLGGRAGIKYAPVFPKIHETFQRLGNLAMRLKPIYCDNAVGGVENKWLKSNTADHAAGKKLNKIDAKVVRHGRHITFQSAEVTIPRTPLSEILGLIGGLWRTSLPP